MADTVTFSGKFFEALELAARAHSEQKRKGTDVPYVTHPVAAAMILLKHGIEEELVIAALLHDTIEDTDLTLDDICKVFGERVAVVVKGCSEQDKSAPWEERKSATLTYLQSAPRDVAVVSCADKLHNIITISRDYELHGDQVWDRFKRGRDKVAWYYRGLVDALEHSLGGAMELYREFKFEVERLFDGEEEAGDGESGFNEQAGYRNAKPVKLAELVAEMDAGADYIQMYLNLDSGEIVFAFTEQLAAVEDGEVDSFEWEDDESMELSIDIIENHEKYAALPDKFEIHEYSIMECFCKSLEDGRLYEIMCRAIKGRGAFRRFKEKIHEHGIADDWYSFRDEALKEIAIQWCRHNRISYIG